MHAISANVTWDFTGKALFAGTIINSARAPWTGGAPRNLMSGQMFCLPVKQNSHFIQGMSGSIATGVPSNKFSTPAPTASISPAVSWPRTNGTGVLVVPIPPVVYWVVSEPQIQTDFIFTRTSPGPGSGFGHSSSRRSFGPYIAITLIRKDNS